MPSGTYTSLGQYAVAEPFRAASWHVHDSQSELKEVSHPIPFQALDQESLESQGIDTSVLVPGAPKADALGSCTANSGTAHLAQLVGAEGLAKVGLSATDLKANEEWAIKFYARCTHQTGSPATEWPPTDCGSSGLFVMQELIDQGLGKSYKSASGGVNIASLLQSGSVIIGTPWFQKWFQPDENGFVDGNGTLTDYVEAVESGVAGGHEITIYALEKLTFKHGAVDLANSWFRVRNSWGLGWGLEGDFRIHLSTVQHLGAHLDGKQLVV